MLSRCNAFIIAPAASDAQSLVKMATRIGFGAVGSNFNKAELPHPVTFFVLHFRLSEPMMQRIITELRRSAHELTRLAPIILISDDCEVEQLLRYIRIGFDDVIALPEKRDELEARLHAQLNSDQHYVETEDYLGPDRHRMELPQHRDERRTWAPPFDAISFRRNPLAGVDALRRRQIVVQPVRALPDATTHIMPRRLAPGEAVIWFDARAEYRPAWA